MEETPSQQAPVKKNNNLIIIVVVLVVVLAGVGLFMVTKPKPVVAPANTQNSEEMNESKTEETSEMTQEGSPSSTVSASPSEAMEADNKEVKTITVTASNFSFDPKTITVKKGQQVKIVFNNTQGFHDFVIDEFDVKTPQLTANKTAEVTFTPTKAGTFEYYCSVGNHRQMGMVGKLIVQ